MSNLTHLFFVIVCYLFFNMLFHSFIMFVDKIGFEPILLRLQHSTLPLSYLSMRCVKYSNVVLPICSQVHTPCLPTHLLRRVEDSNPYTELTMTKLSKPAQYHSVNSPNFFYKKKTIVHKTFTSFCTYKFSIHSKHLRLLYPYYIKDSS